MIVLVRDEATLDELQALRRSIEELGLEAKPLNLEKGRAFEVVGENRGQVLRLREEPGVAQILTRRIPHEDGDPLWPTFTLRVILLALLLLAALLLLVAFLPPRLGDSAAQAPLASPPDVVEWYLSPAEGLVRRAPGIGGWLLLVGWIAFLLWPFVERADDATLRGQRYALLVRAIGVGIFLVLVALALGGS